MRTLLLLLFAIGATTLSQAQENRSAGYGIELLPHLSNRRLIAFDLSSQMEIDSIQDNEYGLPSYSAGIFMNYRGEKIGIRFGLNYMELGYRGKRAPIPFNDPFASQFSEIEYTFKTQQIEAPVAVLFYQQLSEKNEFYFLLGTGISYNLSNKDIHTRYENEIKKTTTTDAPQDFRPLNFSLQTAMGWEHHFNKNFTIDIAPIFKLWMSGLYKAEILNRNLYQIGLRVGIRFDQEIIYVD